MINDVIDIYLDCIRLHREKSVQNRDRVEARIIKSPLVNLETILGHFSVKRSFSESIADFTHQLVARRFGPEVNRRYREWLAAIPDSISRDKDGTIGTIGG